MKLSENSEPTLLLANFNMYIEIIENKTIPLNFVKTKFIKALL